MHLSSKDQRSDNLDYFKPEIRQDIRSACSPLKKRKKERKKDSELFPRMRMLLSLRNFNWQQSYSLQVLYRFLMP